MLAGAIWSPSMKDDEESPPHPCASAAVPSQHPYAVLVPLLHVVDQGVAVLDVLGDAGAAWACVQNRAFSAHTSMQEIPSSRSLGGPEPYISTATTSAERWRPRSMNLLLMTVGAGGPGGAGWRSSSSREGFLVELEGGLRR
jgi:hypothetical protein